MKRHHRNSLEEFGAVAGWEMRIRGILMMIMMMMVVVVIKNNIFIC